MRTLQLVEFRVLHSFEGISSLRWLDILVEYPVGKGLLSCTFIEWNRSWHVTLLLCPVEDVLVEVTLLLRDQLLFECHFIV